MDVHWRTNRGARARPPGRRTRARPRVRNRRPVPHAAARRPRRDRRRLLGRHAARGAHRPRRSCGPTPTSLPFPDATFDGATCGFALRNFASLPHVFAATARVLRPGGRVALLDVAEPDGPRRPRGARRVVPPRRAVRRRLGLRPGRVPLPSGVDRVPPAVARAARDARSGGNRRRRTPLARVRRRATHHGNARMTNVSQQAPPRARGSHDADARRRRPPRPPCARRLRVARRRRRRSSRPGSPRTCEPGDARAFLARPPARTSRRCTARRGPRAVGALPFAGSGELVVPATIVGSDADGRRGAPPSRRASGFARSPPRARATPPVHRRVAHDRATVEPRRGRDPRCASPERSSRRLCSRGRCASMPTSRSTSAAWWPSSGARSRRAPCTPTAASSARRPSSSCARKPVGCSRGRSRGRAPTPTRLERSEKDAREHALVVDAVELGARARTVTTSSTRGPAARSRSPMSSTSPPRSPHRATTARRT